MAPYYLDQSDQSSSEVRKTQMVGEWEVVLVQVMEVTR